MQITADPYEPQRAKTLYGYVCHHFHLILFLERLCIAWQCCVGAAENTRVALHFANAAKRVTMQPHVNEVVNQRALLRKLRDEVALLRKQLVCHTATTSCCGRACAGSMQKSLLQSSCCKN